jgi:hypothetical protein
MTDDLQRVLGRLSQQVETLTSKVDAAAEQRDEDREARERHEQETDAKFNRLEHEIERIKRHVDAGLIQWIRSHWQIVVALSVPAPFLFTALAMGFWQLYGERVVDFARAEIEASARNDRILYQPLGLSFIKEPVEQGGKATYVLVARRTDFGSSCVYQTTVPVFTDELGRSMTGEFESRGRQYNETMARTELDLSVPGGLISGRVVVELQIVYDCDGERVRHTTYPVAFQLRPASAGP